MKLKPSPAFDASHNTSYDILVNDYGLIHLMRDTILLRMAYELSSDRLVADDVRYILRKSDGITYIKTKRSTMVAHLTSIGTTEAGNHWYIAEHCFKSGIRESLVFRCEDKG